MTKIQETNELIENNSAILEMGAVPFHDYILLDIAKSLAIIADSAAGDKNQNHKNENTVPEWVLERYLLRLKRLNCYKPSGDKYLSGYTDAMDEVISVAYQEFDSFIGLQENKKNTEKLNVD